VKIRCCPYLNNIVEQDHRRVKFRLQPMLGFKKFYNARRVIMGIEIRRYTKRSLRFQSALVSLPQQSGVTSSRSSLPI
jgi:transposase-like protein